MMFWSSSTDGIKYCCAVPPPLSNKGMIEIFKVDSPAILGEVHRIRELVFIIEQNVPTNREYDEFEDVAVHFLAYLDNVPVGCIRYRHYGENVKIERLAVIREHRGRGIGKALMDHVEKGSMVLGPKEYVLHSQLAVLDFYVGCGYRTRGPVFLDADIDHREMYKEAG